jgi:hypothetical protein
MSIQRTATSQQRTTSRFGTSGRFASVRAALKPMNLSAAFDHLPCLPFGYGWEIDQQQSGRMTM